jgi:lipopolysaccharide biosynthesis glycosyltransferase
MIQIVCCTDENYAFNFPVIAESVLNHHTKEEIRFFLLHSSLHEDTRKKIEKYVIEKGIAVTWRELDASVFSHLPEISYFTIAMYYRLLIPEMLHGANKVLYLDMDLIVEGRLDKLWQQDLTDKGAAVVASGPTKHLMKHLPLGKGYFNSGVMLINLDYWRINEVKNQAIEFMVNHRSDLVYPDQDALNVVLQDKLVFVPQKWNCHEDSGRTFLKKALKGNVSKEEAPVIIHFNHRIKPWMYHCKNPYRFRYWELLRRTPFGDYRMKNKTVERVLYYWMPKFLRRFFFPELHANLSQN